jgi:group I intron endonuclease
MGYIYQIKNIKNEKIYIGSSRRVDIRFKTHKRNLNNNCHHSYKLQNDWNIYGGSSFIFETIEEVIDDRDLIEREQYWLDKIESYRNGYNIFDKAYESTYNHINQGYEVKISYLKLKIFLLEQNLKLTNICKQIGLSTKITTKINNNENINIATLGKICTYLGIGLEDAVDIVYDDIKSNTKGLQ